MFLCANQNHYATTFCIIVCNGVLISCSFINPSALSCVCVLKLVSVGKFFFSDLAETCLKTRFWGLGLLERLKVPVKCAQIFWAMVWSGGGRFLRVIGSSPPDLGQRLWFYVQRLKSGKQGTPGMSILRNFHLSNA